MKCFLYYEISPPNNFAYLKEKLTWVKAAEPGITVFDLDNHSDVTLKNYALQLMEQNAEVVFYIEIIADDHVKGTLGFLEKIARSSGKAMWVLSKQHPLIDVLIRQYGLNGHVVNDRDGLMKLLSSLNPAR